MYFFRDSSHADVALCTVHAMQKNYFGFLNLHFSGLGGLDSYDAVAYFQNTIEFQGNISPVLLCASTGCGSRAPETCGNKMKQHETTPL